MAKSFPAGIRRVREHRALGHRTLLITGALDFVIEPFRPLFDDVICAHMSLKQTAGGSEGLLGSWRDQGSGYRAGGERGRTFRGAGRGASDGRGESLIMASYAREHGLDLAECVAYADSTSDLPMLEAAGYPVAVNPETKLAALARKRGWHVEHWPRSAGYKRPLLPFGPVVSQNGKRARSKGDMKALQVDRTLARFAMARVASGWKARCGRTFWPPPSGRRRTAGTARSRLAKAVPPAHRAYVGATWRRWTGVRRAGSSPS